MKIMMAIPSLGVGGAEKMVETLSKGLKGRCEIVVVVYNLTDSILEKRLSESDIRIVELKKGKGFSISALLKARNVIRNERPDVIHTHLHALPYFWLASGHIPIIHTVHTIADKEHTGIEKIVSGFIYRNSRKCITVAITKIVRESLIEEYGNRLDRALIVFNGVDFSNFMCKECYEKHNPFEIVHVGRFCAVKNHKLIIDCINILKEKGYDIHISLIGDGPDRKVIEHKVNELGLQREVSFKGVQDSVGSFLTNADMLILPSAYEGMPMSLIEAMGSGLPIVASNVGGIPDMIESGKDGVLITPSLDELCEAIADLYVNYEKRKYLGTNAFSRANRFSSIKMTNDYFSVYTSIVDKHNKR